MYSVSNIKCPADALQGYIVVDRVEGGREVKYSAGAAMSPPSTAAKIPDGTSAQQPPYSGRDESPIEVMAATDVHL